ncbi:Facilitated trehalose transporter Tret1-1 [Operophtera brumata]|uniref:Facilitated trehalose transporter Tret1-1 n=1 Tax=Operophtera brumata TaxID=104452 RepID=A0A0L7LBU4_OPEBR|nr:Facilitated trehalose transporter Tret1-1 [Operophtera brumata]
MLIEIYLFSANFTLLQLGASMAWMSPVMVKLRDVNQTVLPHPLTHDQMSWILSISAIVDLFGLHNHAI